MSFGVSALLCVTVLLSVLFVYVTIFFLDKHFPNLKRSAIFHVRLPVHEPCRWNPRAGTYSAIWRLLLDESITLNAR
jgi:hypothetical protein